jgi:hypothetical protein
MADAFALDRFLPLRLPLLANRLTRMIGRACRPLGLSAPGWRVMALLGEEEALPIREVLARSGIDKARLSRVTSQLCAQGYIELKAAAGDRRRLILELTPRGKDSVSGFDPGSGRSASNAFAKHRKRGIRGLRARARQLRGADEGRRVFGVRDNRADRRGLMRMTTLEPRPRPDEITEEEASRIDMQAFDRLPASYRDLIRYSPIEIPATVARAYLSAFGHRLGLLFLKWAVSSRIRKNRRSGGEGRDGDRSAAARAGLRQEVDIAWRPAAAAQRLTAELGAGNNR